MPTYLYEDEAGSRHEVEQRISEAPYTWRDPETGAWARCKECPTALNVRRLIAGAPRFNLVSGESGGWASSGYSKPEHHRQAEQTLGRKLHKPQ